jgi:hypothetical protein
MIKLTSLNDLVVSLISKSLGNDSFKFTIYPQGKGNVLFEFSFDDYKFIVSQKDGALRIYDNGNIYLIQNIFPENFSEDLDKLIREQAEKLENYYKLYFWEDQINKDLKANVYRFMKPDIF